jgi:hypothetical protein
MKENRILFHQPNGAAPAYKRTCVYLVPYPYCSAASDTEVYFLHVVPTCYLVLQISDSVVFRILNRGVEYIGVHCTVFLTLYSEFVAVTCLIFTTSNALVHI